MHDHSEMLLLAVLFVVCLVGVILLAACIRGAVCWLWAAALVPLFLFGRAYATVGVSPVYLLDLFTGLALVVTVRVWGPRAFREPRLRGFRAVAVLLAIVTVQAVCRGISADYPDPLKGIVLGLYPLFGWFAATWLLTRSPEEFHHWRWILFVPTVGTFLKVPLHLVTTAAAPGLYLAIAGAFGMHLHRQGDSRLLTWTLVGTAMLTAVASKRGPLLAVVVAILATAVAGRSNRRSAARLPVLSWALAVMGVAAVIGFSTTGRHPADLPVVGGLATRLEAATQNPDSEAAHNIGLRFAMWRKAFEAARENPLFGGGAGRPIDVVFEGVQLDVSRSGPHNSFVGYIYYLGWPAGIAFTLLVVVTLLRTWRARSHPAGSVWFGAIMGVCVTAFTNVAFETTFIGLPSWLVLGCAFALVGVPPQSHGIAASCPRQEANHSWTSGGRHRIAQVPGTATRADERGTQKSALSGT
ncbi:O-antigen ligase family protein [Streptomyces shenzhenensis]|uniref:O-antigen ligase family protein n=1 Tax=Streptomyces shenzhenensis TaxID=943815 RepID=UPI0015F07D68|nr:O-antigen ligase family protein [Streptomyces shenzhenensis]